MTAKSHQSSAIQRTEHTEGPWQLVEGNDNHGPYITNEWGRDICDLYTMSNPRALAVCNGGDSKPIWFDDAAANARLIAAAPDLLAALLEARSQLEAYELAATGEHYNSLQINAAIHLAKRGAA